MIDSQISFAEGPGLSHQVKILYHLQKLLWAPLFPIPMSGSERLGRMRLRMSSNLFRTLKKLILQVLSLRLNEADMGNNRRHQQNAASMLSGNNIIHHDHMDSRE